MDPTLYGPALTAVSAFIGVLVAQGVVLWSQRRKTYDEDTRQWQAERRVLYVKFAAEVHRLTNFFLHLMQRDDIVAIANLEISELDELEATTDEIRLISTQVVVEAAEDLSFQVFMHLVELRLQAIAELDEIEDGEDTPRVQVLKPTFDEQQNAVSALRIKFLRAARNELSRPAKVQDVKYFELFPGANLNIEQVRFYDERRQEAYDAARQQRRLSIRNWFRLPGRSDRNGSV